MVIKPIPNTTIASNEYLKTKSTKKLINSTKFFKGSTTFLFLDLLLISDVLIIYLKFGLQL